MSKYLFKKNSPLHSLLSNCKIYIFYEFYYFLENSLKIVKNYILFNLLIIHF